MLLSSRHWLSVGLSQLFILMPTQILLAQNASGEGIAAEAPSGFLAILFSGGIVGAIMILLLLALSMTAAYLIFDHLMTIRRKDLIPEGLS